MDFFHTSTTNLLKAEANAGVSHHVALSVVGTERLQESGYFRAKQAQEELIKASGIPWSIVHATQFFEFMKGIAESATEGDTVRLAPVKIRPVHSDDVAATVGRTAVGTPVRGVVEVAGPDTFQLDELIRRGLAAKNDPRTVLADPHAPISAPSWRRPRCFPARTRASAKRVSAIGSLSSSRGTVLGLSFHASWNDRPFSVRSRASTVLAGRLSSARPRNGS